MRRPSSDFGTLKPGTIGLVCEADKKLCVEAAAPVRTLRCAYPEFRFEVSEGKRPQSREGGNQGCILLESEKTKIRVVYGPPQTLYAASSWVQRQNLSCRYIGLWPDRSEYRTTTLAHEFDHHRSGDVCASSTPVDVFTRVLVEARIDFALCLRLHQFHCQIPN